MERNIGKLYGIIILTSILFALIFGYIRYVELSDSSKTETKNVNLISVTIPLSPVQVESINYTEFSAIVVNISQNITVSYPNGTETTKTLNYSIRDDSTNTTICFYIYLDDKITIFDCTIFSDKKSNNTFLSANIYGSALMSEKDIEDEKEAMKSYVEKIVSAANINIGWSKAEWSVSYAD